MDVRFDGDRPLGEIRLRYQPADERPTVEAQWPIATSDVHGDATAAPAGLLAQIVMAQLAELLADSVHASTDSPEQLRAEARALADRWNDADFDGVLEVIAAAEPLLVERRRHRQPVLDAARQLAFAHYQHLLEQRRDPSSEAAVAAEQEVAALEAAFRTAVDAANGAGEEGVEVPAPSGEPGGAESEPPPPGGPVHRGER